MSDEQVEELREVHGRAREMAEVLEAHAAESLELTKRIEKLTDGTPAWYAGMRSRIEAAEALLAKLARVLVRTLEAASLGERTRARG